jgi:flagellar basal-body rod modification protein FlgD
MSVTSTSPTTSGGKKTGTTSTLPQKNLNATDFINLMVTQLQNQDPLQPTDSSQLLSQMSQIGQLQASTTLQTTLSQIMMQSQLTSAGNLIGKHVTGMDAQGNTIKGNVNSVKMKSDGVYVELDTNQELSLSQVNTIDGNASTAANTGVATAGTAAAAGSTVSS